MGYDLHITRAANWYQGEDVPITRDEWLSYVDKDPELELAGFNGSCFTLWLGHPTDEEAWLDWSRGNVFSKHPDELLIKKMARIAIDLEAKVQGDDLEVYLADGTIQAASVRSAQAISKPSEASRETIEDLNVMILPDETVRFRGGSFWNRILSRLLAVWHHLRSKE